MNIRKIVCFVVCLLCCSCSIFFPAHSNSYDVAGESIGLKMLTQYDMETLKSSKDKPYSFYYKTVFEIKDDSSESHQSAMSALPAMAMAAPVINAALNYAFEYVKENLEEEAALHTAQFGKKIAVDKYWKGDEQNYYGFEITRVTKKYPDSKNPSFRLVYGIKPSDDQTMFLVAPLFCEANSSKAKISTWKLWSIFPLFWYQFLLANYQEDIETSVNVEIASICLEKNQKANVEKVAVFSLVVPNHSIEEKWFHEFTKDDKVGWFPGIQRSHKEKKEELEKSYETTISKKSKKIKESVEKDTRILDEEERLDLERHKRLYKDTLGSGTFWVSFTATERDSSKAKKYIDKSVEAIDKNKEKIIEKVIERLEK